MKFQTYYTLSLGGLAALCMYAVYSREQFYPIVLFLVTSKMSYVVGGNLMLATALLLARVLTSLFLGKLRDSEMEMLSDKLKFTIIETCLALTIFRSELTPTIIGIFGGLLFMNAFHWLAKSRIEMLDQVMPVSFVVHCRLVGLLAVLGAADMLIAYHCIQHTVAHGKSVIIMFAFEFGLLVVAIFNMCCKYTLQGMDAMLANGLPTKGLYVMLVDLLCDALRFMTYLFFFSLVFVYYGMPVYLVRELWSSFYTLQKNVASFYRYLRITANLEQRFENATAEELEESGGCLICREPMTEGKKLPCRHVFHLSCLRMWLQHQQACPLCRQDIPVSAPRIRNQAERRAARLNQVAYVPPPPLQRARGEVPRPLGANPTEEEQAQYAEQEQLAIAEQAEMAEEARRLQQQSEGLGAQATTPPVSGGADAGAAGAEYTPRRSHDSPHDRVHDDVTQSRSPSVSPSGGTPATTGTTTPQSASSQHSVARTVSGTDESTPVSVPASGPMPALPSFFNVEDPACPVHTAPTATSGVTRTVVCGTVVFVLEMYDDSHTGMRWARIPDGWVHYSGGTSGRVLPSLSATLSSPTMTASPAARSSVSVMSTPTRSVQSQAISSTTRSPMSLYNTPASMASAATSSSARSVNSSARVEAMLVMQERMRVLNHSVSAIQGELAAVQGDLFELVEEELRSTASSPMPELRPTNEVSPALTTAASAEAEAEPASASTELPAAPAAAAPSIPNPDALPPLRPPSPEASETLASEEQLTPRRSPGTPADIREIRARKFAVAMAKDAEAKALEKEETAERRTSTPADSKAAGGNGRTLTRDDRA